MQDLENQTTDSRSHFTFWLSVRTRLDGNGGRWLEGKHTGNSLEGYRNIADIMRIEVGEGQWKLGYKFESNCRSNVNIIFYI